MPHTLNIDGVSESLFLLQTLVHSSKSFCGKHKIQYADETEEEFNWDYYFGWLKTSICENLIRSSITLRMLQDILAADEGQEPTELQRYQNDAISRLRLGDVQRGSFELTLREVFIKIIHATDTQLDWNEEVDFEWWSGSVWLYGVNHGSDWALKLNVEAFATAAACYIDFIEENIDWHHLYKHDT
ncbi:MAG: hypothetical protein KDA63_16930 [Planctomycetales bacterium]|nr:hypothetical protein [Planctomycetales bacterium]